MKFFSPFFKLKPLVKDDPKFVVTEGISGVWHYHISTPDRRARGLCDARTMYTAIPVEHWGMQFGEHFPKRPTWCAKCKELYDAR